MVLFRPPLFTFGGNIMNTPLDSTKPENKNVDSAEFSAGDADEISKELLIKTLPERKKHFLRLPKVECLTCGIIFDAYDEVEDCNDDPECPAHANKIVIGRDPEAVVEALSFALTEAVLGGDSKENAKKAYKVLMKFRKDKQLDPYLSKCLKSSALNLWI